ncbi:MAG: butyrate kinase [Coriobacteriales bacterium]|jgi:butyrate kinase
MADTYKILAINPGSTSTKIAIFENDKEVMNVNVAHEAEKLNEFAKVQDQLDYRKEMVEQAVKDAGVDLKDIDIFVGRGGGLHSVSGGTYKVDATVLRDAAIGVPGQHPAQLASQICAKFVEQYGGEAYIVNPPDTDEFEEIARFTGIKGVYRQSHTHALNQKEIALRFCKEHGLSYDSANLIVCHIGGGVSVTAHKAGKMVDGNDIIKGEGPMTPTRVGALPTITLLKLISSGEYDEKSLKKLLTKNGGFVSHLGTSDAREVEKMIDEGNTYAKKVYDAMIYQIAKYAGEMAVVLKGKVDGIILTGGISYSKYLVAQLKDYLSWICEVTAMPGEFEMEALAAGCMRVKRGEEEAKTYSGKDVWDGVEELK